MTQRLKKGYLKWRCRRGTKELDVVLDGFLEKNYNQLTDAELIQFDELLNTQDTQLWYWLSGQQTPEKNDIQHLISKINSHA